MAELQATSLLVSTTWCYHVAAHQCALVSVSPAGWTTEEERSAVGAAGSVSFLARCAHGVMSVSQQLLNPAVHPAFAVARRDGRGAASQRWPAPVWRRRL